MKSELKLRAAIRWPEAPDIPELAEAEVHVWAFSLEGNPGAFRDVLSKAELERAARFHFARHRRRFINARRMLRVVLGRYLDTDPGSLQFGYGVHGKPELA